MFFWPIQTPEREATRISLGLLGKKKSPAFGLWTFGTKRFLEFEKTKNSFGCNILLLE
jgi:hypothetical protein